MIVIVMVIGFVINAIKIMLVVAAVLAVVAVARGVMGRREIK